MIKEVKKEVLINFIKEETDNPFRKYFTYDEKNIIKGYFIIDILYDRIELINIFVKKEDRNRKIGTNMLKYLIDFAKVGNFINITLEVEVKNVYAIKLYEKFSFKKVAMRKGYYQGIDGLLMELKL